MDRAKTWKGSLFVMLALISLGIAGCAKDHPGQRETAAKNDAKISDDVKDALKNSQTYKYPYVTINTYDGMVNLSGFVNTEPQKREAAAIAQNVRGVRQVIDNLVIKIEPTGRPPLVESNIKVNPESPGTGTKTSQETSPQNPVPQTQ